MLVAPEQFRSSYTFGVASGGSSGSSSELTNYLDVVTPTATVGSVTLDGAAIAASTFTPIGTSG